MLCTSIHRLTHLPLIVLSWCGSPEKARKLNKTWLLIGRRSGPFPPDSHPPSLGDGPGLASPFHWVNFWRDSADSSQPWVHSSN